MSYNKENILEALKSVRYPGNGVDIVSAQMLQEGWTLEGNQLSLVIQFPKNNDPFQKSVIKAVESAVKTFVDPTIEVSVSTTFTKQTEQPKEDDWLPNVNNIVAVFSGKGGVGKSTVTANLAVALSRQGFNVGLIDADIYGPSMPKMFACEDAKPVLVNVDGRDLIDPIIVANGAKLLSIGFFVDPDKALMWRGSMACNALSQLIRDANWGKLDYLLIDMPPGTGDIHLTLVQSIAITGSVVVTTPQQVAVIDAEKGINMFEDDKVNVPILGLVENMAWFTPAELPDNKYFIFGKDGGRTLANKLNVPLLAQIPLVQSVCESGDSGAPIATDEHSIVTSIFDELSANMVAELEKLKSNGVVTQRVKVQES